MCGVIGAFLERPTLEDFDKLKRVFIESSIRGLHATGLSYLQDGKIYTIKEAVPARNFEALDRLHHFIDSDSNLYMIGHCRYSTSDLEFNQPIANDNIAIVHNGVISQELPENWKELYGYDCTTKNDSELILRCIEAGKTPTSEFADMSMSVVELHSNRTMNHYRNGKRPLYVSTMPNGRIVTSTRDIAIRSGLSNVSKVGCSGGKDFQHG